MTFKAMLLDERDVLLAVVELADESALTARHVDLRPYGGDCDRAPGEYRWNRTLHALEPLPRQQRAQAGKPTFEQAVAFDYLKRWGADPASVSDLALSWLDELILSHDFAGFRTLAPIVKYAQARGIDLKQKQG